MINFKIKLRKLPGYVFLAEIKYLLLRISVSMQAILKNKIKKYKQKRREKLSIDESNIIFNFFQNTKIKGEVMFDVGAGVGNTCFPFAEAHWKVHCFEPNTENRNVISQRIQKEKLKTIVLNPEAVSDKISRQLPFYKSDISSGISGLSKFHESHIESGFVDTVTLSYYINANKIEQIDFLKVDTEGYDFFVLRGFPWERLQPKFILCEFENFKSKPLSYLTRDMIDFLIKHNYSILVSEWLPVIEYGMDHRWKGFFKLPYEPFSDRTWGNLIGIKDPFDFEQFLKYVYQYRPSNCFFNVSEQDP